MLVTPAMQQLISASVKPLVDIQNDIIMLYLYNMIYIMYTYLYIFMYDQGTVGLHGSRDWHYSCCSEVLKVDLEMRCATSVHESHKIK